MDLKIFILTIVIAISSCTNSHNNTQIKPQNLGDSLAVKDTNMAIKLYYKQLQDGNANTQTFLSLSQALFHQKRVTEVENVLRYALDIYPQNNVILVNYIKILIHNKKYSVALNIFENTKLNSAIKYSLLGLVSLHKYQFADANITYDSGIKLYPDYEALKYHKIYYYLLTKQYKKVTHLIHYIINRPSIYKKKLRQMLVIALVMQNKNLDAEKILLYDLSLKKTQHILNSYKKLKFLSEKEYNNKLLNFAYYLLPDISL